MARATHVKAARRNYTEAETGIDGGIKKGQSYYWWKFAYGSKRYSLTAPRRSQLTQSDFYAQLYDIEDRVARLTADENLPSEIETLASDLRQLAEEQEEKQSNMPDSLQESDTGQMLSERADACNGMADELEGIETDEPEEEDYEQDEGESDEDFEERKREERETAIREHWESVLEQVQAVDLSSPN